MAERAATGLRERKKERTRQLIAETARSLFQQHGFEYVTVARVAATADVSEATVYNYFPTKEDLFYSGMEVFEARLIEAIRARPAGETALAAFSRVIIEGTRRLADPDVADVIRDATLMIEASPALRAREREVLARHTVLLAELLASETRAQPDDAVPLAVASAMMGAQRALVAATHARILAGERGPKLAAATRRQAHKTFALLERGLAGYAAKRAGPASSV
ncbi:MAG TPA: TetR family transcriptional regulator [Gaiellales bacterium]|jgi:AcrR family transcriptional regulator|nr:TetR family transcriptional regulator [Gaiellales bacterium]